ncbi:FAD/NAD(P)-binding domain-containing protein [Ganoderma leucocontextum]|nr:FAD/NAD(P)-binding domain-containing protein [Ganoderma leucocontextum]
MKVAVVGSGVSGLAATWLLNEYTDHEVHLFEADSRPGGHANTVTLKRPGKQPCDIVFNPHTYPNFLNFLNIFPDLTERIIKTEMTFSVSRDMGAFEWAGNNLFSVFCQGKRLLDLEMWRLLYDLFRFNANTQRFLIELESGSAEAEEMSIGTYLQRHGYSDSFRDNYLIPMTAAIWSTPPDKCSLDFPAKTLIRFMHNHYLLQVEGRPKWLTLRGGSRTYVQKILSRLAPSQLHLSTPVQALKSLPGSHQGTEARQLELTTASGEKLFFDHVIFGCHSDTTVRILEAGDGMAPEEARILGSFKWSRNEAVLHSDIHLMPKLKPAWSSWNYLSESVIDRTGKCLPNINRVSFSPLPGLIVPSDWMGLLQDLPDRYDDPILVTLNPPFEPKPDLAYGRFKYDHPILSEEAIRAQALLPTIQNIRGISFAGAWTKYGFHEDGFTSGLRAAAALAGPSAKLPFKIVSVDRPPDEAAVRLARWFDLFERWGAAWILGKVFASILAILKLLFRVDLRYPGRSPRDATGAKKAKEE